jgi:EF-P beta-lysylation protein EpmB
MIHRTQAVLQEEIGSVQAERRSERNNGDWQRLLAEAITDPRELFDRLQLPADTLSGALSAARDFPLRVPEPFLQRMKIGDPDDPLLRQVLPLGAEQDRVPGFLTDPLQEQQANPRQGVIHKYRGRVLLVVSGGCAVNCRYCFRRHFPYGDNQLGDGQWQQALDYIGSDPSIHEVIFSGGDPLATPDRRLAQMIRDLEPLPHLKRLRIHTRLPVVIPQRLTPELINLLSTTRLQTVLVTHINHGNEIDLTLREALRPLVSAGITLLNQAVLLRGVNDSVAALTQLSEALFSCRVLPYYLHVLDPVQGAAHFSIPDQEAAILTGELMKNLPGYLVPKLVREVPGEGAKMPLMPRL